jgi:hypothetical protein
MAGAQMVTAPGRAAELAVPLSIAVRIEPDLIRAMRLAVLPYLDVAAESDLWFSDLVASRESDSIIFEPEILPALRGQLADWLAHSEPADPVRAVWDIIKRVHAGASPALLLEERVAWLAVSAGDSGLPAIEEELRSALYSLLVEGRTGIADWFAGAWGRFPDTVRNTRAAWQLRQAASRYIAAADLRLEGVPARLGVADVDAPPRESRAGEPIPLRIFVSSASGALAAYRYAAVDVCHRLRLTPVYMEEFDPQRPTLEQASQEQVDRSDVFVLLLGHRYGARPPGRELSYTELEYRWAAERPELPLLAFVAAPNFPWPPDDIDRGADADALAQFVAQVKSRHEVKPLGEIGAFREDLLIALSRLAAVPSAVGQGESKAPAKARPTAPAFLAVPPYVGSAPFTGRAEGLAVLNEWGRSADPVMVVEAIGGTGKSALTWQWVQDQAPAVIGGLAGRLWWSFYESSASITRFLQELLAYTSGQPMPQIRRVNRTQLADEALAALRRHPYLVVLDGFERLLAAYHRFDPSKLRDEEVGPDIRSLIDPQADDVVRRLADAGPSKILISTRLMPTALQGRFGEYMPGVQHLRLPGLTDADTRALLARLGVRGSEPAIAGFFGPLGNHPMLAEIVAGLVRDYRPEPGGFDQWLTDPTAGGTLHLSALDLTQRRTHILAAALDGLQPEARRLLGWLSALAGSVNWPTLEAINPFQPEPPSPIESDLAAWRSSEPVMRATAQLDAALKDLEERGLLWWDRSSNSYGLHPIIRAYAYERLEAADQAGEELHTHGAEGADPTDR